MTESKARYIQFCSTNYVPLSFQPWWLDAVCGPEGWGVCLAEDGGGNITGAMPWYKKRRLGLWVVQQPPLSTYAGPWLAYPQTPDFKLQSRYAFEKKTMVDLIGALPGCVFFQQNFRPEIENWLPFYWQKFRQTTRYTYVFDAGVSLENITAGMKNTLRTDLKKAEKSASFHRDDGAFASVFQLNKASFNRKNMEQPYDFAVFEQLHQALATRRQSACWMAYDVNTAEPHAGLYLVFDDRQAAVLLTGVAPAYKQSCAIYGLFWEAIVYCAEHGLSLDFEGSMQPEIEHVFRAFGARLQPYFQVSRAKNRFFDVLFHLKSFR